MFTVVGSSRNIKVGLAMNANAALTLRLFPPLDNRQKELNGIKRVFEVIIAHLSFCTSRFSYISRPKS